MFLCAAYREGGIDLDVCTDFKDALLDEALEAWGRYGEAIGADWNVGQAKDAGAIGDSGTGGTSFRVDEGHVCVGDCGAGGVGNGALNAGGTGGLGVREGLCSTHKEYGDKGQPCKEFVKQAT